MAGIRFDEDSLFTFDLDPNAASEPENTDEENVAQVFAP